MTFNEFTFTIFASIIAGAYASIVLIIIMAGTSVQTWLIQAIVNIYDEIEIEIDSSESLTQHRLLVKET